MTITPTQSPRTLALPAGYRFFWYEIRAVLGQGGFGITYLAQDTNLDQPVAIKEYLPMLCAMRATDLNVAPSSDATAGDYRWGLSRFLEEGRLLARFDHPAVVRVHSVFEALGTAYLVMRYEQGETLDARLRREKTLDEPSVRRILGHVMEGLEVIHGAGFIHRDVKPANIYLRANGQALLIDFGTARQALNHQGQTMTSLVSPGYAPFEQYRSDGAAQGPWTDIYGLGATAYRAITGRAPVPAVDRSHRILDGEGDAQPRLTETAPHGYGWDLLAAVDRALAFRVAERPASVAALRALLDDHAPVTAEVPRDALGAAGPAPANHAPPAAEPESRTPPVDVAAITVRTLLLDERQRPRRAATFGMLFGGVAGLAALFWLAGRAPSPATPRVVADTPVTEVVSLPVAAADPLAALSTPALLQKANADMQAMRLTVPAEENALAKYRAVLMREPDNVEARSGLDRIVGRYLDLAAAAALRRDFAAARGFLERASEVNPEDPRIAQAALALARQENPGVRQSG